MEKYKLNKKNQKLTSAVLSETHQIYKNSHEWSQE